MDILNKRIIDVTWNDDLFVAWVIQALSLLVQTVWVGLFGITKVSKIVCSQTYGLVSDCLQLVLTRFC